MFYGWWIVAAGVLANFAYAEQFNTSYGVFVQELGQEKGWGRTLLAGVNTVSRVPEAIVGTLLGPVVDRHGARWLVAIGGLLVGGAFFALATIEQVWQLYLYKGIIQSVGAVCLGGFIGVTVSNWFVARRGRALGIIQMGAFLATGTMPLAAAFMIEQWGWRLAWAAMGVLVLLFTLPAAVVFRRRPEDVGLAPDGIPAEASAGRRVSERERKRREQLLAADVPWTTRELLRQPAMWIVVLSWGLSGLAVTGTNLHLVPYLQELGYPLVIAAGALSLRALSAMTCSPLWGLLAERFPVTLAASGQFAAKGAAMLLFLWAPTPAGIAAGLLIYGLGVGGNQVVLELLLANFFGRTSLGRVRSLTMPLQLGLAATGPLVIGILYDLSGGYESSWVSLFWGFVFAAAAIAFSRPPRKPGARPTAGA